MFALPLALGLILLAASPALAAGDMPEGGALSRIASPGTPWWMPDAWLWTSFPAAAGGLARGGWRFDEAGESAGFAIAPEPSGSAHLVSSIDSVAASGLRPGSALEPALARFGRVEPPAAGRRSEATFLYITGDPAMEEAALRLAQGDSLFALRYEVWSGVHGESGPYQLAGRHRWEVALAGRRGAHGLSGFVGQAGTASSLASGERGSIGRQSGGLDYRFRRERWSAGATFRRVVDARESDAPSFGASRRDAQQTRASADVRVSGPASEWSGGVSWSGESVRRTFDPEFLARADVFVSSLGWSGRVGDGTLAAGLDVARHGALRRTLIVPASRFAFGGASAGGQFALARLSSPVWTDLAAGETGFLQDTWAAELGAHAASAGGGSFALRTILGRTSDRAIVTRLPLDELWLRLGASRDSGRSVFGLVLASAVWNARSWEVGADAFGLSLDRNAIQANVDPSAGFRAWAEARTRFFGGDLGATLRLQASGVGEREPEFEPGRTLPAYVTIDAALTLELGDAKIVVRGRELEDRPHEEGWTDLATGLGALSPGRAFQTFIFWRFFN